MRPPRAPGRHANCQSPRLLRRCDLLAYSQLIVWVDVAYIIETDVYGRPSPLELQLVVRAPRR